MSSYINNRKHFDTISLNLQRLFGQQDFYLYPKLRELAAGIGCVKDKNICVEKLVANLRNLQVACVCYQYKHRHEPEPILNVIARTKEELRTEQSTPISLTLEGLYKVLGCAMYQIELFGLEQVRPLTKEERNTYDFFEMLTPMIAEYIVNRSKEYNKAPWSI